MRRRLFLGAFAATTLVLGLATPVLAHGDHDARPVARDLHAGPYRISLWQVYPDIGSAMTPHLIVMFDDEAVAPREAVVSVAVDSRPMETHPSTTTANGWETTDAIAEGDVLAVSIADGIQSWDLAPVTVPPPPTSMLPMRELLFIAIYSTLATAGWVALRTARAWRRPTVGTKRSELATEGGSPR